jgi:hypothetical protein
LVFTNGLHGERIIPMSQKSKTIKVKCDECGLEDTVNMHCPYTGYRYTQGWITICPECKGTMKEVK